jgi:RecJ-like exonuclease
MEREVLEDKIRNVSEVFIEKTFNKEILLISHFDTDGITSAALMIHTLKKLDRKFTVKIVKSLEKEFIMSLPEDKIILFLDLASGSLEHIKNSNLKNVFIIDHHEIPSNQNIPENVLIVNPELCERQKISASGVVYLFCKKINPKISDYAKLAVLGMIGDMLEKEIDKLNNGILNDSEIQRRRGLLIYPSTRPINRVLEFNSNPYILGITGNSAGVQELLRESGFKPEGGKYKSLIELTEEEMSKLITSLMLHVPNFQEQNLIGDIYLIKIFNKLEDARELSAMINACSKLGEANTALQFCLEIPRAKKKTEELHIRYKQLLISGLRYVETLQASEKITGNGFVIVNAKDQVQDTIIGTIASIMSNSSIYQNGTIITTMAYYENKIKVSARCVGKNGRNVRELLSNTIQNFGGEVGGHEFAAGCIIQQTQEQEFIDNLKRNLEIEMIKI